MWVWRHENKIVDEKDFSALGLDVEIGDII
jgi:hypothetical protein